MHFKLKASDVRCASDSGVHVLIRAKPDEHTAAEQSLKAWYVCASNNSNKLHNTRCNQSRFPVSPTGDRGWKS